ncbi:MAG TPA: hypothetical protein VFI15_02135 [Candidatus Limnocylindrales bacterium]|nr:hypothetical protein [Candidatus Limnocylindrales bacterium]
MDAVDVARTLIAAPGARNSVTLVNDAGILVRVDSIGNPRGWLQGSDY